MDRHYFLSQYETHCLERTFDELILMYPLVSPAQIRAYMVEIRENCPEAENLD